MTHSRSRNTGFTLVELLVAIVIVLILLSIFIPYLSSIRETSRRTSCANNLQQIFNALQTYAKANQQAYPRVVYDPAVRADGYVAFTGANDDDPFKPNGVEASDVSASLFMLVRLDLAQPQIFTCPSSNASADTVTDRMRRGNFASANHLRYSYALPFSSLPEYRFNSDHLKSGFVLMADRSPGSSAAGPTQQSPPMEIQRGNSRNHSQAGQNVLYSIGVVEFHVTPYCGFAQDNIYTAQAAKPTTQPVTLSATANGYVGRDVGPASADDTYLVPTDQDE